MIKYHIIAFHIGILLDFIIGDPYSIPHPIRWIGSFIHILDQKFMGKMMDNRNTKKEKRLGFYTVFLVTTVTLIITLLIILGAYVLHPILGIVVEAILTCYIMAAKSLKDESMKVYDALKTGDLEASRYAVSMIVGRDTNCLNQIGVAKAAVETVAENTSDGVIAPLLYTFLGGPVLGFLYKSINTMDSMIGYHNDRFEYFGKVAAKLDDIVNFLPARISAFLMIASAFILGKEYDGKNAYKIFKRDRFCHKSPNSAQTESACAGALHIQLAGDASYFGKIVKKPYIGDDLRPVEFEDIKRSNHLMYCTSILAVTFCDLVLLFTVLLSSCHN